MTKAERLHYAKLTVLGCIVCHRQGHGYTQPEIHHLRNGAGIGQKSHWNRAIPLCHAHHRTGGHGVAYHAGKIAFEQNYGTEIELLVETEIKLKEITN